MRIIKQINTIEPNTFEANRTQINVGIKQLEDGSYSYTTVIIENPENYTDDALLEIANKAINPQSISPRQARLALLNAGLLDEVDAMLVANKAWQIEWEYATKIERVSPLISAMAMQLNLTDTQIDEMFASAAQL